MTNRDDFHPRHAVANPEQFYEWAFENTINPTYARIVGNLAVRYAAPEFSYHDGASPEEFFGEIDEDSSVLVTFSHDGEKHLHDVSAAAATVFQTPFMMDRLDVIRVWAKNKYLTSRLFSPLIRPLGTLPVNPAKTLKNYGIEATDEEVDRMQEALYDRSDRHLEIPGNILVIFPAGTRGGDTINIGVGKVLEKPRAKKVTVVTAAMVSDSAKDGETTKARNRPENLRVAFGEKFVVQGDGDFKEHVAQIDQSLSVAADSVRD